MNVFVLSTGRCGSMTFARACGHFTNYTAAHESRIDKMGPGRLDYPDDHIESDNRLSWFLGRLQARYGDRAAYVHLRRDRERTAQSYSRRLAPGLMLGSFARGVYQSLPEHIEPLALDLAYDMVDTVNANIEAFLADKTRRMTFRLENAVEDFPGFCEMIGARGDLEAAAAEFTTSYNTGGEYDARRAADHDPVLPLRALYKFGRILRKLPHFVRSA